MEGKTFLDKTCDFLKKRIEWAAQQQGKHFCQCGCNGVIPITKSHYSKKIPRYLRGHNPRSFKRNCK